MLEHLLCHTVPCRGWLANILSRRRQHFNIKRPRRLQGLVTNDVAGLEAPGAPPMYTAILNAQGRFLYDLFLHRQPGGRHGCIARFLTFACPQQ